MVHQVLKAGTTVEVNRILKGVVLEARIGHGVSYLLRVWDESGVGSNDTEAESVGVDFYEEVFRDFEITSEHKGNISLVQDSLV